MYDLPESEEMFLPSNMDAAQLMFRFKEVTDFLLFISLIFNRLPLTIS